MDGRKYLGKRLNLNNLVNDNAIHLFADSRIWKSKSMKEFILKIKKSPSIWVLAIIGTILSLASFWALSVNFKDYQSTVKILVISKSEKSSANHDRILNTIAELPKTLTFYEKLLAENPEIKENRIYSSLDEKKENWNSMIKVSVNPEDSSIIELTVISDDEKSSQIISNKSARNLFNITSNYYDVKNDIDLRIIEGPIVKDSLKNAFWLFLASILLGYSLAVIFQRLFVFAATDLDKLMMALRQGSKKNNEAPQEEHDQKKDGSDLQNDTASDLENKKSQELKERETEELERLNKIMQQDIYPNFPEMPISEPKKASAPDNLPIADVDAFEIDKSEEEDKEKSDMAIENEKSSHEPTPEEIRKRLNQLLRGK